MLVGDFNVEKSETSLAQFSHEYNAVSMINENACYKSINNASWIDLDGMFLSCHVRISE